MTPIRLIRTILTLALLVITTHLSTFAVQDPSLSPAEDAIIARKIATLHAATDRSVAQSWSSAKKAAEFLCRPAALPILKKQSPGTDRVFLGTDDPSTLTLVSSSRLTGTGQYRTPQGWQDITFTCNLDPQTGKVTSFQATPSATSPGAK